MHSRFKSIESSRIRPWIFLWIIVLGSCNTTKEMAASPDIEIGKVVERVQQLKNQGIEFQHVSLLEKASEKVNHIDQNRLRHASVTAENSKIQNILNENKSTINMDVPLPDGRTVSLDLYLVYNLPPQVIVSSGKSFVERKVLSYQGMIEDDVNTLASITVTDNHEVVGFVTDAQSHTFVIQPVEKADIVSGKEALNPTIVIDLADTLSPAPDPSTKDYLIPGEDPLDPPVVNKVSRLFDALVPRAEAHVGDSVKLYWETDYDVYVDKGSVAGVDTFILGIFDQVQTLYANDGITIELKALNIWDTADPYNGPSKEDYISQFRSYRTSFNGDVANLIGYQGGGGIAWVDGLCSSTIAYREAYAAIDSLYKNVPTYSWSVNVIAHEIGHVLGSRHTHDCVWNGNNTKIDSCGDAAGYDSGTCADYPPLSTTIASGGGTIMSYCHLTNVGINFNLRFGPQPKQVMQSKINGASCLTPPGVGIDNVPPMITITNPSFGSRVSGTVSISATAQDYGSGMTKVEFFTDGNAKTFAQDSTMPYEVTLDTTSLSNGSHILKAVAHDYLGNTNFSTVSVTVSNCEPANPTLTVTPPSQTKTYPQPLEYEVIVTNNDSSICTSRIFNVSVNVDEGFIATLSTPNLEIPPGGRIGINLSVDSFEDQLPQTYVFNVVATADSNSGSASAEYIIENNKVGGGFWNSFGCRSNKPSYLLFVLLAILPFVLRRFRKT